MKSFKDLKSFISKSCRTDRNADLMDKFSFNINFEKLEKILNEENANLHVLSFTPETQSYIPTNKDYQLLVEYLHSDKEIKNVFDGKSQICTFMLYSSKDSENGNITFVNEDGENISESDLFDKCNRQPEENSELIKNIVSGLPMYQVLVVRSFSGKKDKFEYQIYFRSNFEMISYVKFIRSSESIETTEQVEDQEKPEETVEE